MDNTLHQRSYLLELTNYARTAPFLTASASCALFLILTRLWTGFVKARRQSNTGPPEKQVPILPYWLPYVGHAISFAWSFDDMLAYGRDITTDGIFGLRIMGSTHNFVLMPSLAKQIFLQRPAALTSDDFIHWIHDKYFGDGGAARKIGHDNYHAVHQTLTSLMKEAFLKPATDRTAQLVEERTPHMFTLSTNLASQNEWERCAGAVAMEKSAVEVNLFKLTMNFVGDIAGTVLMGKAFLDNNPGIMQDLWTFDSGFNALLTGVPVITRGLTKATNARARINSAVHEWNHAVTNMLDGKEVDAKWNDLSDVSETMRLRLRALQKVDADNPFAIASNVAVYWGLMVNANKVIFWMLLHIISNPDLLETVRKEIKPYAQVTRSGFDSLKLDVEGLLKSCPILKSCFFESMRLYTAGVSYKKVLQNVTLTESAEDAATFGKPRPQTYHIKTGDFLIIPEATLQTDPRLWKDPSVFWPERYLVPDEKDPQKTKVDSLHLFAFGGGPSVCKGRIFAEREVLIFVAALISVWDFTPVGKWTIPKSSYNGTGSANPKSDLRVRMSRRV
ncbi:cytochrome P450 [Mollisia scopiformis]|uniref:Cytochrome P450 n=1 Tax=Mollisia scopiformis TaxID=149040 RepID=A0A194XEB3_MOLSC|nr:cytochrome P450 [Mollisia scopiformis]KUJ18102.1 cytochrome P450 [Mollisia scopiformis]